MQDVTSTDAETIGKYLIQLSAKWKPFSEEAGTMQIGNLYGFDLFIRRQRESNEESGMYECHYKNIFYAEGKETGIKYSWNQGHINIDNPKLAARYFLNAIDRVESLKEKYEKQLKELERNIPMMQQIIAKPFEKEDELIKLKMDVSNLEREITTKIQASQMKQQNAVPENAAEIKEVPVIKMDKNESKKAKPEQPLLIKKNLLKEKVAA